MTPQSRSTSASENRSTKESIVESNESDQGSKAGSAVPAMDLGLSPTDWEESQELEAFLAYAYDIKDTIEKRGFFTGAQGLMLLYNLKANYCSSDASLKIKEFPASLTRSAGDHELRDNKSRRMTKEEDTLCAIV